MNDLMNSLFLMTHNKIYHFMNLNSSGLCLYFFFEVASTQQMWWGIVFLWIQWLP